jgi:preprotein translocase subunit Sec61beta
LGKVIGLRRGAIAQCLSATIYNFLEEIPEIESIGVIGLSGEPIDPRAVVIISHLFLAVSLTAAQVLAVEH